MSAFRIDWTIGHVQSRHNWMWALLALVVWLAIFFAFLLIAITRH